MNLRPYVLKNRFPLKQIGDIGSMARVLAGGRIPLTDDRLSWPDRLRCLQFYFRNGGCYRLHAMLPRTGSHWSELVLATAVDIARGGNGSYTYQGELYHPRDGIHYKRLDWRVPTGRWDEAHQCDGKIGELFYYHTRLPYFRLRSGELKKMKIVVLVRSIIMSLAARRVKWCKAPENPSRLQDNGTFRWDHYVDQSVEFFNSWGDVLTWHPNARVYRYEDLVAEPVRLHKEILDFWDFSVPESCVAKAVALCRPEEMKKSISPTQWAASPRIPQSVENPELIFPPGKLKYVIGRLKAELDFDYGYGHAYDENLSYDFSNI